MRIKGKMKKIEELISEVERNERNNCELIGSEAWGELKARIIKFIPIIILVEQYQTIAFSEGADRLAKQFKEKIAGLGWS